MMQGLIEIGVRNPYKNTLWSPIGQYLTDKNIHLLTNIYFLMMNEKNLNANTGRFSGDIKKDE
jgi:hypothetical protein